mmetsp:Transcript_76172/g.204480  ORF Transcript_76172/g.204480 Transcript_76172/m.204480 type:complete len:87 (-) Transcript_76172:136-396(-)
MGPQDVRASKRFSFVTTAGVLAIRHLSICRQQRACFPSAISPVSNGCVALVDGGRASKTRGVRRRNARASQACAAPPKEVKLIEES